jgi:hypothetical protein
MEGIMKAGHPSKARARHQMLWIPGVILLAAAILRLLALGREGLWCDEAYTALTARLPIGEMIQKLVYTDDAPPLFYLLQKLTTTVAGSSETALRLGPALAGILAVALLLWYARRGGPPCTWGSAFMAVAAYSVFYSRQARSYALIMLLALVVILSARELLAGQRRAGPVLALSGVLLCLTHHLGVILLLTSLLLWPLGGSRRPHLGSWGIWHGAALVVWGILWICGSAQLEAHRELNAWMGGYWETHALGLAPLYSMAAFLPGGLPAGQLAVASATAGPVSIYWNLLSLALGLLCLLAAFALLRGTSGSPPVGGHHGIVIEVAFLVTPLIALMVASWTTTPVYVLGRTDALAFPAFALLIGRGLSRLPHRLSIAVLIFWIAMTLLSLAPSYGWGHQASAKGRDRQLAETMHRGGLSAEDWVVHTYLTAPSLEYYLERYGAPHQTAYFPEAAARNPAALRPASLDSLAAYVEQAAALRRRMEETLPPQGAVWILALVEPGAAEAAAHAGTHRELAVEDIGYPMSALVYALVGTQSIKPVALYRQDWVSGQRVLLRIVRSVWVPPEDLPPIDVEATSEVLR